MIEEFTKFIQHNEQSIIKKHVIIYIYILQDSLQDVENKHMKQEISLG